MFLFFLLHYNWDKPYQNQQTIRWQLQRAQTLHTVYIISGSLFLSAKCCFYFRTRSRAVQIFNLVLFHTLSLKSYFYISVEKSRTIIYFCIQITDYHASCSLFDPSPRVFRLLRYVLYSWRKLTWAIIFVCLRGQLREKLIKKYNLLHLTLTCTLKVVKPYV